MANDLIGALAPLVRRVRTDVTCVKQGGKQAWTRESLTKARLAKHLDGGPARGCCPIKAGEAVTLVGLYDLDSHNGETAWPEMAEAAMRLIDALGLLGMHPIAFRSSGGRGIHLFLLWDEPQDAYSVRQWMASVIESLGFRNGAAGISHGEIEIFPKQDSVPENGFGNQFILPLAGLSEPLEPLAGLEPMGKEAVIGMAWPSSPAVPVVERPVRAAPAPIADTEFTILRSALAAIPNQADDELDYDTWRNVIFGIHHATGGSEAGLALAHELSAKASKYDADFLDHRVWPFVRDRDNGITERSILMLARQHGWQEDVSSDFEGVAVEAQVAPPPLPAFKRDKYGRIEATIENAVKAVACVDFCAMNIRFDSFRDEIMYAAAGDDVFATFSDADYSRLRIRLESKGFKPVGRELIRDAVGLVADNNPFDSAIAWLNALPWDGHPRVENFLRDCFGASDTDYVRAVSLYLWTALAGRVLSPGVKADMVPILVGDQGAVKSSSVAAMVPGVEFFTEISFSEKDEDLARKMRGRLIAEIAELRGLHTRELDSIKAFIARTHETWVPKYREFAVQFPRRLVFIGTTNQDEFLADETGNRRWLPVRTGKADIEAVRRDRLQLWAEARELFGLLGVAYQAAERLAPEVHVDHTISDPWDEAVASWLDTPDLLSGEIPRTREFLRAGEVLRGALGFDNRQITKREEMRVGISLRACGLLRVYRRINGVGARVWVHGATTSNHLVEVGGCAESRMTQGLEPRNH
ncbi:MAG TPA: hypothetical protein DHV85_20495 [Candidatus Accumulibacter sp.]|nr:hypothetical protein [Accumulibacter sp.]